MTNDEQEALWAEQRRWCEARYWLKRTKGRRKDVLKLKEDLRSAKRSERAVEALVQDMRTLWSQGERGE